MGYEYTHYLQLKHKAHFPRLTTYWRNEVSVPSSKTSILRAVSTNHELIKLEMNRKENPQTLMCLCVYPRFTHMLQNCFLMVRSAKTVLGEARAVVCRQGSVWSFFSVPCKQGSGGTSSFVAGEVSKRLPGGGEVTALLRSARQKKKKALSQAPEAIISVNTTYPFMPGGQGHEGPCMLFPWNKDSIF